MISLMERFSAAREENEMLSLMRRLVVAVERLSPTLPPEDDGPDDITIDDTPDVPEHSREEENDAKYLRNRDERIIEAEDESY